MLNSRRQMLLAGAAIVAGTGLGGMSGCPSNTTPQQILQGVIDAVQAAVATACGFVPSVATLLAILSAFPGIGGVATIGADLLAEVSKFLCTQFAAQGGATAAIAQKTMTGKLKDGASVPIHGLVFDPATGKFVQF